MANGQLRGEDLVQESVFQVFKRLEKAVLDEIKLMNDLETATRNALGGTAVGANANKLKSAVERSNTALTEQEKVLREINRLRERNTQVTNESLRKLVEERTKRSQITKALKDEAVISSKLTTEYAKLRKQRDRAANTLRDLVVSNKSSNRELRRAQREFDTLNNKVKKADRAIGNFRDNVGNYGSAVNRVVGFSRQLVAAFGIYSSIQIGQEIFEQVKALDALKFGLEQVTDSQEAFNRATLFLDTLADRAGADLVVLTRRYTNFLAAAKTTTLTLRQTEEIFGNVVIAGSALGRSTDDINGALRALEQILSKGKVQAEELRGQLGERLPGAFQILEKALNLNNGELNELLELGGLLSTEAIPALAKGLEDAFDLDTIDRVETLAASQARLTTEFTLFLRDLEGGEGTISRIFKGMFDALTGIVGLFRQLNGGTLGEVAAQGELRGVAVAISAIRDEAEKQNITLKEAAENLLPTYNKILEEYGEILSDVTSEQSKSSALNFFNTLTGKFDEQQQTAETAVGKINLYKKAIDTLKSVIATGELPDGIENTTEAAEANADTLQALRLRLKALREELEITDFNSARFANLGKEIKDLDTLIKKLTGSFKEAKVKKDEFVGDGSIKFAENLVREFNKARDAVEVGSEAWFTYSQGAADAEKALESLKDTADILSGDLSSLISADDIDFANEVDDFLNNEGLDIVLADFANRFKLSKEEVLAEYLDLYGRDFDKFKEFEENKLKVVKLLEREKLALRQRTLDLAEDLSTAFLELQLQRLDEEEERQNEVFESIANNKEVSEEQIAAAENKRDENEKRLAKEKQKRENQAFLFRQALSVADIFIADALARANAVASTSAIIPYIPLGASTLATLQALITTNTAVAIGSVLAQSIPKLFYKGKSLGDNYSGDAIWGELQREVKVGAGGEVEISPDAPTATTVKSSDIIHSSLRNFVASLGVSGSETARRIRRRAKRSSDQNFDIVTSQMPVSGTLDEYAIVRAIRRGFSGARLSPVFNITNNSTVRKVP